MTTVVELLIEIFLTLPGALLYKLVTRSKKSLKLIILEGPDYLSLLGLPISVFVVFIAYQIVKLLRNI